MFSDLTKTLTLTFSQAPLILGLQINTVKLCYSESGRPRHIFSLLLSSRYSQMMNLPRETKGNNLGENANGTVRTQARRR